MPTANLIGEVDRGFVHMMERLPQERLGAAVSNIAHAAQILEETLEYTKERRPSASRSASFQHNKFLLAELVTKVEVTQAFVDDAVLACTRRGSSPRSTRPRRSGGPRRCRTTCSTPACSCTAATAT